MCILLTGNRIVESLLGKVASLVGSVEDLVVEDGEVEGKTEADGVGRGELSLSDLGGGLVCLERLVGRLLALIASGEFCEVAVVVTLPVLKVSLTGNIRHGDSGTLEARTSCGRTPWTRQTWQK